MSTPAPGGAPPAGGGYVEDPAQITGLITANPRLAALKVLDGSGRQFTVDARNARVQNGNKADLDRGRIIRVKGVIGSVVTASTILILK